VSPLARRAAAVTFFAFFVLAYGLDRWGLAGPYVDPIGQIRAQDEAVYSHIAIQMATQGDALTPRFLHRFALFKPPLAYWLAAASVRVTGVISRFTLRLPSVVAGALAALVIFLWTRSPWAPALALTSTLFYTLSRLALTDALLTLLLLACAYLLHRDEKLAGRYTGAAYGLLTGLALMTKGIAGLLPLLVLALYALFARPRLFALVTAAAVAGAVAAPWHLYQLMAHPRWFLAEYVGVELFAFAVGAPPQTSGESTAAFYFGRFFTLDPALAVLGLAAFALAVRRKRDLPLVALALVLVAAVFAYQYRNLAYWMPLVPVLAILAARHLPAPAVAVALALKLWWAVPLFQQSWEVPPTAALARYCEMQRGNDLFVVALDDDFQATTLPLARVRYVFIAPRPEHGASALDFHRLGVTRTVDEYLAQTPPPDDLLAWGLPDRRAVATVILARDAADVARLIEASPGADFLTSAAAVASAHRVVEVGAGRRLLLAPVGLPSVRASGGRRGCRL